MNNVVILCDGDFPRKDYPLYLLDSADAVVCCDGSVVNYLRHTRKRRWWETWTRCPGNGRSGWSG